MNLQIFVFVSISTYLIYVLSFFPKVSRIFINTGKSWNYVRRRVTESLTAVQYLNYTRSNISSGCRKTLRPIEPFRLLLLNLRLCLEDCFGFHEPNCTENHQKPILVVENKSKWNETLSQLNQIIG